MIRVKKGLAIFILVLTYPCDAISIVKFDTKGKLFMVKPGV